MRAALRRISLRAAAADAAGHRPAGHQFRPRRSAARGQSLGQPRRLRRARLRRHLAVGLVDAARLPRSALHRLRARQRLARHQRHRPQQRQRRGRQPDRSYIAKAAALAEVFRPYGIKVYLSARFSAPRDLGGFRPAIRSIRRCARGGRPRPTRSIARSPTSAGSWSRPTAKASRARRTTAAPTPTAPTCSPRRSPRTAAS